MSPFIRFYEGDVIELKKPHPCGANRWRIERLGIDLGLRCEGCGHYVLVPRARVEKRFRRFLHQVPREGSASPKP